MKKARLTPVSFLILGMVASCGAATSYEINKLIDGSVGYFWPFPRTQLYVEPLHLVERGFLVEEQEETSRRRHTYRITPAGEEALRHWIGEEEEESTQIRDLGLLKLYFAHLVPVTETVELAMRQERAHARQLQAYEQIHAQLANDPPAAFALATLRMGIAYEQESVRFWQQIAQNPPQEK